MFNDLIWLVKLFNCLIGTKSQSYEAFRDRREGFQSFGDVGAEHFLLLRHSQVDPTALFLCE